MSTYSFTMHHLASRLPSILHAPCMVSYKDDLYKLLLVQVMIAPTILVSTKENLGYLIEIRVDVVYPAPVAAVAFLTATVRWEDIEEELFTLRERAIRVVTKGITLFARVRSMEAFKASMISHHEFFP
nr:hypothetical protein [Tanacetum cinerariifolium]